MNRVAVMVDAGYLCTGGAQGIGHSARRADIRLDVEKAYAFIENKATMLSGVPLLRFYWYDGAIGGRLTTEHQLVSQRDNIKLRLGIINGLGQQKEVDTKLVTDLAELARNRAISDAVLIGGDGDLRLGIELAQQYGVRVHLLTIAGTGYSHQLRMEADTWSEIQVSDVQTFLSVTAMGTASPIASATHLVPTSSTSATVAATGVVQNETEILVTVVADYLASLDSIDKTAMITAIGGAGGTIPSDHNGRLLARAGVALQKQLDSHQKRELRAEIRLQLGIV